MAVFRRTRFYIAAETTFSTDPDSTGAAYLPVRVFGDIGLLQDGKVILPTQYFTGRNTDTPSEVGNDLAMLQVEFPMLSFPTAAGAAQAPPADDWSDLLLNNAFGLNVATSGAAVTSSTATTLTTSTSPFSTQDLIPVRDTTISVGGYAGVTQWRRTSSSASPYTVHEAWGTNPTSSAIAQGIKRWGPLLDPGGASLSAVYDLDSAGPAPGSLYTLSGGRIQSLKLMYVAGGMAKFIASMRFDQISAFGGKASLPAVTAWAGTPIKGQLAVLEWGGTSIPCKSIEVDWGVVSSDSESVLGAQGRGNIENLMAHPFLTVTPLFTSSIETDFRVGTQRNALIRFGSGIMGSGTATNTWALWFENAQVTQHALNNDQNRMRQQVRIACRDPGIFAGSTPGRYWQLARS